MPATTLATDEEFALAVVDGAYVVWRECVRSIPTCDTSDFDRYLTHPQRAGSPNDCRGEASSYEMDGVDSMV